MGTGTLDIVSKILRATYLTSIFRLNNTLVGTMWVRAMRARNPSPQILSTFSTGKLEDHVVTDVVRGKEAHK